MSVHEDTAILNFSVDNYEMKFVRKLHSLAKNEQFCDVALVTNGAVVHTHRAVLCASSQYFATLLSDRWSPSVSHDVSHLFSDCNQLQAFVSFLYTGKIKITNQNIDDILNAGTHLLVDDLRDVCAKYLAANLSLKNCLTIWMVSERYQLEEVSAVCKAIASSRFQDYLIHQEEAMDLEPVFLEKIVNDGVLEMVSQEDSIKFLLKWRTHQAARELTEPLKKYLSDRKTAAHNLTDNSCIANPTDDNRNMDTTQSYIRPEGLSTRKNDRTEAIFAFTSQASSLDMYVYLRNQNQWKNLGTFTDKELGFVRSSTLVGFLGSQAIFDEGYHGRCFLVDFKTKTVNSFKCPTNGANLKRYIFCFDGKVFLIQDTSTKNGSANAIQLLSLDPDALEWQSEIAIEKSELIPNYAPRANISYTVLTSGAKAYIWAQDLSSTTLGPYWMCLEIESDGAYTIQPLENPPLSKEDLRILTPMSLRGWKHANFKFSVDASSIYVYRNKILTTQSMTYDLVLAYDTASDGWSRKDNVVADFPKDIDVPVISREQISNKAYVTLDHKCKIQSRLHGCTYMVEKACPFVARLWAHSLSDGKWEQMAPPPVEEISAFESYNITSVAKSVSDGLHGSTSYSGISEDSDHSPMIHWELDVKGSSKIRLQSPSALMIQQCIHS